VIQNHREEPPGSVAPARSGLGAVKTDDELRGARSRL